MSQARRKQITQFSQNCMSWCHQNSNIMHQLCPLCRIVEHTYKLGKGQLLMLCGIHGSYIVFAQYIHIKYFNWSIHTCTWHYNYDTCVVHINMHKTGIKWYKCSKWHVHSYVHLSTFLVYTLHFPCKQCSCT